MQTLACTKAAKEIPGKAMLVLCLTSLFLHGTTAQAGTTNRISVDSNNKQANGLNRSPTISADGRFVAFISSAKNLVPDDTNGTDDIFVHDRQTGHTTRASVDSDGNQANARIFSHALSANGRFVAFASTATNLVTNDTNEMGDIFVHDRQTGYTTLVSIDSNGNQANGGSNAPALSANGRFVAFMSSAKNLVPNDTNGTIDIFVHDRHTGDTTRVNVDSNGNQANTDGNVMYAPFFGSVDPTLSANGRFVAFASSASNLVPDDTNGAHDVFVHDRQTARTTRVTVDSDGNQGNSDVFSSFSPVISANGRFVAFNTVSNNLVPDDTNGVNDVFIHDRQTARTTRVNVDSDGNQAENGLSFSNGLSADGRFVAFSSDVQNLTPDDTNARSDSFIHDRETGHTTRVSVDSNGNQANDSSSHPALSADGRFVVFSSNAQNLIPDDTNAQGDIFVHDREQLAVTAVIASGFQAPHVPDNTLDKDLNTRWSANGDGQWIQYDLGFQELINEIRITWYRGDQRQAHFSLEVSLDAATWIEVFSGRSSGRTLASQRYGFNDVKARYLRIVGHGNTDNNWNSITEVEIHRSLADDRTLPITFVTTSGFQDPNVPDNTLDTDLDTRWSAEGDDQWIQYDLGSSQTVIAVHIAWYRGDQRQARFDLEVSLDAMTWTQVFSGRSSGRTLASQRYDFGDVQARYVRIVGHGNTDNAWNSITEVEIIGRSN